MKEQSTKISVIVPVYNVQKYLSECLDSIARQTFTEKEVILIDDGSTDNSGKICDFYASMYPEFHVIHKDNGGPSSARNLGINKAHGKWIIFIDADDLWSDKNCLIKLFSYAESMNLDALRFEYQAVNESLEPIEPRNYDKSMLEGRVLDNYELVKYAIAGEWFTVLHLLRKDIIGNLRFNEQTRFQEDTYFYCRLFASKEMRCGYLNERMYLYRKRGTSISTTANISNVEGSFNLCDIFYEESQKITDSRLQHLYIYYSVMMYCWTLSTISIDPYYHKRKEIIHRLSINALRESSIKRMKQTCIPNKYRLFLLPHPKFAVWLIRIKNQIISKLK